MVESGNKFILGGGSLCLGKEWLISLQIANAKRA
jgi:hypothetical protein